MSVLASAVGAFIAAILESSVLTHLQVGSVKPDLVFAVGIAVAMVLGFESGVTWAFVGGLALDLLMPGRSLGASALALLAMTGLALIVARALWPPRLLVVAATAFVLTYLYQGLLFALLAISVNIGFVGLSMGELTVVAIVNAVLASIAVIVVRALDLRFGEPERVAW